MPPPPPTEKRTFLHRIPTGFLCALGGAILSAFVLNALLRPGNLDGFPSSDPEELEAYERARNVKIDPQNLLRIHQEVDYAKGSAAPWYPKGQTAVLADLEARGAIPPVADRVGPEPAVLKGIEGIGRYGGTWLRVASSLGDVGVMSWRMAGSTLVRWSPHGYPIVPNVARAWEHNEDYTVWRFHLRKGMRWSDGHEVTADDFIYWYYDDHIYFRKHPINWMMAGGVGGSVVKIDAHTVEYRFAASYKLFLERMASQGGFVAPSHYLRPYHPEYGDPELIKEAMERYKLPTARSLYFFIKGIMNPEHPRIWPWIYRTARANPPHTFVRNPYYWAVDEAGNQLPYVDRVMVEIQPKKQIVNSAAQGRITLQARNLTFDDYTLLMSNRRQGDYEIYHWYPSLRSGWALYPNMNRHVFPDDPTSALRRDLLNRPEFRQALSLAIDRESIIASEYSGIGTPSQIAPGVDSEFHHEVLSNAYVTYDPDRANRILDGIGLENRDVEGMRLFPDGQRMTWQIWTTDYSGTGPVELVIRDWARVGVRAIYSFKSRVLFDRAKNSHRQDFMVWMGEGEFNPLLQPRSFTSIQTGIHAIQAEDYARWFERGGLYGNPAAREQGAIEPPVDHPLRAGMELVEQSRRSTDFAEQKQLVRELLDIAAENLWTINIATPPPQICVVKNGFRNVPRNVLFGADYMTPANGGLETFYFDQPVDSSEAMAQLEREMTTVTPLIQAAGTQGGDVLAKVLKLLILGSVLVACVLLGIKHPYVGRRLLILVPTLIVISAVTFIVIQLPPSNFIDSKIEEMRVSGDDWAIAQIEEMKTTFRVDDPAVVRYARWLGLNWFFTGASADLGLLQGHLGRSMEDLRPVNDVVGDRLLLTVAISLGTILFTWAMALPIGIYSAVKQYSIGDYIFTFIGFLGMCLPSFLLALLLMYWGFTYLGIDMSGLFSAQYVVQPEWSWGKFLDLLKHLWVPIVVLGTGGTAWMVRVMRANLLDELSRPYVVTARAKGVKPLKLLLKYPVRLALNPFVSGIGSLFPRLVSGGAIVAIVLSLPTIGPLMLSSLLMEDTYMAGSLLMVLSLLGVLGTLVSDLLLLALDPRIRMEGGSR